MVGPAVSRGTRATRSPRQRGGETIFSLPATTAGRDRATAWATLAAARRLEAEESV